MTQFSRILAAVDFSTPARGAFDYALALSKKHQAKLAVIQAVPVRELFGSDGRERLALAAELRQRAADERVDFTYRVQHGDPADVVLMHALALRADVIVVGAHQRTGFDRLVAGSVAERVATKATVPVLVIPETDSASTEEPFRHVVVAVDFTPASEHAIEQAFAFAGRPGDRITLLHVVAGSTSGVPPHFYRYGGAEYQRHLIDDARQRLQLAALKKGRSAATVYTRVLVGDPTTEIVRVADSVGADLLIAGVPKRGLVSRALFGTTAARLVRATPVPMLAVPAGVATTAKGRTDAVQLAA